LAKNSSNAERATDPRSQATWFFIAHPEVDQTAGQEKRDRMAGRASACSGRHP
jgi:hypothetical protein